MHSYVKATMEVVLTSIKSISALPIAKVNRLLLELRTGQMLRPLGQKIPSWVIRDYEQASGHRRQMYMCSVQEYLMCGCSFISHKIIIFNDATSWPLSCLNKTDIGPPFVGGGQYTRVWGQADFTCFVVKR